MSVVPKGYTGIHMDDCWEEKDPVRDPETGRLQPNATRFPSGLGSLGKHIHDAGATFGLYTAESRRTCGGYPASQDYEKLDAATFAEWGVDYLKVDGCNRCACVCARARVCVCLRVSKASSSKNSNCCCKWVVRRKRLYLCA